VRYGSEHKAETRSRILKAAAREFRLKGPDKVAVADLMASAGLTHGGFYAHFASKDVLVAEAVDAMFADGQRRNPAPDAALADETADRQSALRAYLASYLSPEHRDRPDRGCPLPALSADIARNAGAAQARFALGLDRMTSSTAAALTRIGVADPGREASAAVAQMVGAVALARAVGKGAQSDAILRDTLASLSARLGL
jgi:TetR/AcrR family transcriptional regulator, transcriptional repressor for nem operon